VQRVRRLLARRSVRRADGAFVAEGAKLLEVALQLGAEVEAVYLAPEAGPDAVAVAERAGARGVRVFDLAPGVLGRVADTATPQPVLSVVRMPVPPPDVLVGAGFVVVCADVRDPGNAGTVIRTAAAAGADVVVCAGTTVDPYNPKTVRASAGSVLRIPIVVDVEVRSVLQGLGAGGVRRLGAMAEGGRGYDEVDWRAPCAVVLGNEAAGLGPEVGDLIDEQITIPMARQVDSLSVSTAAAVLCFAAARQRSNLQPMTAPAGHRATPQP